MRAGQFHPEVATATSQKRRCLGGLGIGSLIFHGRDGSRLCENVKETPIACGSRLDYFASLGTRCGRSCGSPKLQPGPKTGWFLVEYRPE